MKLELLKELAELEELLAKRLAESQIEGGIEGVSKTLAHVEVKDPMEIAEVKTPALSVYTHGVSQGLRIFAYMIIMHLQASVVKDLTYIYLNKPHCILRP